MNSSVRDIERSTVRSGCIDVAIIGAGPYGLSTAAYLQSHRVDFRIFGSTMRFWRDMLPDSALKTFDFATSIYGPKSGHRFVDYCRDRGIGLEEPIPMSVFAEYGVWAQRTLVPQVEDIEVAHVAPDPSGFRIELASGETVRSRRVVVAVGVGYFPHIPEELARISPDDLTHTFARRDYSALRGKDVTVIGGGQSAIEAAAFLQKSGARTRMLVREQRLLFAGRTEKRRPWIERLRRPQSVAGVGWDGLILQYAKTYFHYVPEPRRVRFTKRSAFPFGTWWLKDYIDGKVEVLAESTVQSARAEGGRIVLSVRTPSGIREIVTDHVVAGTGYHVDVARIPFLARSIIEALDKIERTPRLSINFESSHPGLYFIGPIAALSFGPLLRFVTGAEFAAPAIARHLSRTRASQ